jgi:signal transduction histidine kinase
MPNDPQKKKRSGILLKMVVFMLFIALMPLIIAAFSIKTFNDLHQKDIEARQIEVIKKFGEALDKKISMIPSRLALGTGGLTEIAKNVPEVELLTLVDAESGRASQAYAPRYTVPDEEKEGDMSGIEVFRRSVETATSVISGLRTTMNGPVLTLAVPTELDNKPRILLAVVNVSGILKEAISENENPAAGYMYVTDHEGRLLLHSVRDITSPISLRTSPLVGSLLYKENIKTEGQKRYVSYWQEDVVGSGQIKRVSGMAQPVGIFVELPSEEADFIFGQLVTRFSWITFVLLVVTLLLSFYLTLTLVRPIRELERGTERAAMGKFDEPVSIRSGDELEELAEAFNGMMKGLKELATLREEFVFVAAHELRAPVGIIKGYLSILLDNLSGTIAPTVRTQLEKIKAANERLVQLIEDLLEVSREEAGRLEIKVAPIEISEPIAKVVSEAQRLADDKKISLTYKPGKLPLVLADSGRIGEIVMNLVSNAIKYSPNKAKVTITHKVKDKLLLTEVQDNGFGISAEAQEKLFEKFYRVRTAETENIQGTGLGLFIARKIVEKMGGEIFVKSAEGKGSTFGFTLPIAK